MRDGAGDYGYNVEAARAYHARGAVSPSSTMPQYSADMSAGDVMSYRQSSYPYGSTKGYYPGWGTTAYSEDGVDYGLNYQYPHLNQDPVHMMPGYRYGSSSKASVYVDPEPSTYSYGSLVHRPAAVSSDLPNFSLSGMAASLPSTSERVSPASRTLASSSAYRADGLPGMYTSSKASTSQSSDVGYSAMGSSYDTPYNTATLPSNVSIKSSQSEAGGAYQSASGTTGDGFYGSDSSSYRGAHESDGYVYSERFDSSRRDSQSSGGAGTGSVLSNGHVYVPESQSHSSSHGYSVSSSHGGGSEGATTAAGSKRGSSATSSQTAGHRRSAGKVRGA
jgi:hypothetical protein